MNFTDPDGLESMTTSDAGVAFIASYEKFKATPYKVNGKGKETIGYGHEIKAGENLKSVTEEEARALLKKDLKLVEDGVNQNYSGSALSQQQFDALVSLGVNAGRSELVNSDIFSDAENGVSDPTTVLADFRKFITDSSGAYLLGLDKRRYDEAEMYLYGDYKRNDGLSLDNPCSKG